MRRGRREQGCVPMFHFNWNQNTVKVHSHGYAHLGTENCSWPPFPTGSLSNFLSDVQEPRSRFNQNISCMCTHEGLLKSVSHWGLLSLGHASFLSWEKLILNETLYCSPLHTSVRQYNVECKYYWIEHIPITLQQYFHWSLVIHWLITFPRCQPFHHQDSFNKLSILSL